MNIALQTPLIAQSVDSWLEDVNYSERDDYIPTEFALEFVNFIKLVNGSSGEENLTPVLHYRMLDQVAGKKKNICNMLFRGSGKTTVMAEYLFLYIGCFGSIPGFGVVTLAMYVSDSIENGVKNMRKNLEHRWENSDFLRQYIPNTRFTDVRWEFNNINGNRTIVKGYGASTGVRGVKEMGTRPVLAILDDLISDEDARSPTIIANIEDTVYKAVNYALHPKKSKIIWSGTPFNSKDPLYKAVESGAWYVNVYPVCEAYPCTRKEFRGAWEDRFDFNYVKEQYDKAVATGKIDTFNQELMLKIMSDEDRLIQDSDIRWYKRENILDNRDLFNFYITTDFATSEKTASDYSVISVWALNNKGYWFWVDGVVARQLMDKNVDDLFRLCQEYSPQQVGIEVTGQQYGFVTWIQGEMMNRNIWFNLASEHNSNRPGIRPNTNKMSRFLITVPWFKTGRMFLPEELKQDPRIMEMMAELQLAAANGFRSKHDDVIDTISMLSSLTTWKPSEVSPIKPSTVNDDMWEFDMGDEETSSMGSYIV